MPSKTCRLCYDKIIKSKKFREILEKSTVNQLSLLRFKRCKTEADTPSGKSPATRHQRKKKAADNYYTFNYSDQMAPTSRLRVQLFRPILPSTEVYKSTQDEMIKKRVLPRETFPQTTEDVLLKLWSFYVVVVSINQRYVCNSHEHKNNGFVCPLP